MATGTNNITIGVSANSGELASIGLTAGTTTFSASASRQSLATAADAIRTQIGAAIADGANFVASLPAHATGSSSA